MDEDDNFDFYYDETDDMFGNSADYLPPKFQHKRICQKSPIMVGGNISRLESLMTEVFLANILPFICERKNLSTLAVVSKHFMKIVFSDEAEQLWNQSREPFQFCIDTYCPICLIKKRQQKGSMNGVLRLLEKCPIYNLNLHCFITDIPRCLIALSKTRTLKGLDLTLSNKSNSPPLEDLFSMSNFYTSPAEKIPPGSLEFPLLKELTLDSSHLQHVNLPGRARLLDILGVNLESLSFSGLSPSGAFSILSSRCPKLLKLRVDRVCAAQDILSYSNPDLEELDLRRAGFLLYPGCLSSFPSLKSVKYTPSFRCDSAQIEGLINALPAALIHLSLEAPSQTGDTVLDAVSKRMYILQSLSIQGSHELGTLSADALLQLGRKCLFLQSLEVSSAKSVSDLVFDSPAFMMLASFPSLKKIRIKYDAVTIKLLPGLLKQSDSIRGVVLWERKRWIRPTEWVAMVAAVDSINKQFLSCTVELEPTL